LVFLAYRAAFRVAAVRSGRVSYGHRFLSPAPIRIEKPDAYSAALRSAHVLVDPIERKQIMVARLAAAAQAIDGLLIEDAFLVEENASLSKSPQVIVGSFEPEFLALPERVILDVAKVISVTSAYETNRAHSCPSIWPWWARRSSRQHRARNDRVMRARLSDAKFFYDEDLKIPLAKRRSELDAILFHKRLGERGDKSASHAGVLLLLGESLQLSEVVLRVAHKGGPGRKIDLVSLMVRELPELRATWVRPTAVLRAWIQRFGRDRRSRPAPRRRYATPRTMPAPRGAGQIASTLCRLLRDRCYHGAVRSARRCARAAIGLYARS